MDRVDSALRAQAAAFVDDTDTWQDRRGYTLSDRIWSNKAALRSQIDGMLRDGIRNGETVDQVSESLMTYIRPSYAPFNGGTARYAATRLARHETARAHALATRDASLTDPAGGYLRYTTAAGHIEQDECTDLANRNQGYGRGVYPAKDAPLPPRHVGCRCFLEVLRSVNRQQMRDFVEQLRVEYDLADPPDLSPAELVVFRRETAAIRQAITFMFRAWFEQTGLVTTAQLVESSPTVRDWVESVKRDKARRRG